MNTSWLETIKIDRASSDPLFLQLKIALEKWIQQGLRDGMLSTGNRIPSERDLCENLGISGITVKRALNELQREGVIQRIQGRGSFIVQPPRLILGLERLYSLTSIALERGMRPTRCCLQTLKMPAPSNIAKKLNLEVGDQTAKIVRLRMLDETPLAVDTSYVPLAIFPHILSDDLNENSLYDLMIRKYGVEPVRAREYFEPTLINDYESQNLGVPVGSAAMLIARIAYDAQDTPIEFNKSVIRGDMCRFYVDMLKENL